MYDSAKTLFRVLARFLHGRDSPFLGQASAAAERLAHPFMRGLNRLPRRVREQFIAFGTLPSALAPAKFAELDAAALARANIAELPKRRYPAIVVGSSNGAGMHLAAALGCPWLPQNRMVPVRTPGCDPDEPEQQIARLAEPLERFAARNSEVWVCNQHDPAHDRLPSAHVAYVRIKWLALPLAYRQYIADSLEPGGRLIVLDCAHRRPMTQIGERHWYQFGGLDSVETDEYFNGGPRVAEFLARRGARRRRWEPPAPTGEEPEAEWGFHPVLWDSLHEAAETAGAKIVTLGYSHPQQPSAFVADLHRWWYRRRGQATERLLVDQFLVTDPMLTLATGSVPYWTLFPTEPACSRLADYLGAAEPYDDIRLTLFSCGLDTIGDADGETWGELARRWARRTSGFLGVSPKYFPTDLRTTAGFHHDLARLPRQSLPAPLTLAELDEFAAAREPRDEGVTYRPAG